MRLFLGLLVGLSLHAETPWSKVYRVSLAAAASASIADAGTSLGAGKGELNPLLAFNGRFGVKGVALKSAIVGGAALCGWLAQVRHGTVDSSFFEAPDTSK